VLVRAVGLVVLSSVRRVAKLGVVQCAWGQKEIGSANVLPQQSRSEQLFGWPDPLWPADETSIWRFGRGRMLNEQSVLEGVVELAAPRVAPSRSAAATHGAWEGERAIVDVVAPDRFCAYVFLELMGSSFPFELVGTGTSWVIKLHPPLGSTWEARLLVLVQRWLENCPLPCATIGYGGRRYLFRSALTHTRLSSGFDRRQGLIPSQAKPRSPARIAIPRARFRPTQATAVSKR